jgi:hypothetical protein
MVSIPWSYLDRACQGITRARQTILVDPNFLLQFGGGPYFRLLESYPWPGNIRELQNVIERSLIVCETANFSVDESRLSQQPLKKKAGSQLYLSEKVAAQEKELNRSSSARMPRTSVRTVGRSRQTGHATFDLGIEDSVTEDQQESLQDLTVERPSHGFCLTNWLGTSLTHAFKALMPRAVVHPDETLLCHRRPVLHRCQSFCSTAIAPLISPLPYSPRHQRWPG